jgi:LuxR family maltose regulon positive regulatory protein
MVLARLLIAQGRANEATRLLDRLREPARAAGRVSVEIENLIIQALAWEARGDTTKAVATMEEALVMAQPGGFIRVFVDEGPPVARLLYVALTDSTVPAYIQDILAAFPAVEPEPAIPTSQQDILLEPLSERELEVLHLIADGLSNAEIAARLFISLNTVKAHTRTIYGKLDVHSRTKATAKAQGLGLLSSP